MAEYRKRDVKFRIHEMVHKVYTFLKDEYSFLRLYNTDKCDLRALTSIQMRTSRATGLSLRSVVAVLKQNKNKLIMNIEEELTDEVKASSSTDDTKSKGKKKCKVSTDANKSNCNSKIKRRQRKTQSMKNNKRTKKEKRKEAKCSPTKRLNNKDCIDDVKTNTRRKKLVESVLENNILPTGSNENIKKEHKIDDGIIKFVKQEIEFADFSEQTENEMLSSSCLTKDNNELADEIGKISNQYTQYSNFSMQNEDSSFNKYTSTCNTVDYDVVSNIKQELEIEYSNPFIN